MRWFRRLIRRWGREPWFAALMSKVLPPTDRVLHRLTGGRATVAELVVPVLMLTTTGHRSGRVRETPLTYVELERGWAVAATSFGRGDHPAWSQNLLADPRAEVTIDRRTVPVRARLVDDEERERLMPAFIAVWPAYRDYRARLTHRDVRVFRLEPADEVAAS